jgi:glycosyltransferase 2 family protein
VNRLTPARRKWLFAAIKLLIVVLVVWFIRGTIAKAVKELQDQPLHLSYGWLAASAAFYLVGLLPQGWFWYRVLGALGQKVGVGETWRAYFIGHLGKYVPGKAMVILLRAGLIHSPVDRSLVVASVFLETLTMMSVGSCIAAAILAIWFAEHHLFLAISIGVMCAAGLPTLPPVFSRLARLAGVGRWNPAVAEKLSRLSYKTLAAGWVTMAIGWVLMGVSLWAVLRAMGIDASLAGQLHLYTATIAMAVVGGFVAMTPGGIGVREAVLTGLLGHQLGDPAMGLIAAAILRLVWLVAEAAVSTILYFGGRRSSSVPCP